ncbi:acyl-coenzyme A thioesterase 1-like isoform X1 [Macrobrachium nipponense]|uniref:acyl-coenzyme A thioesterase 1-like isoform X1 n=1 Tax=Macrobrachium nipponense TaxID=159736 RepID=UPI0030C82332
MSSTSQEGAILSVNPLSCLHDEPVCIKVSGLKPNQDVTLHSSMKDVRNIHFMSYAHYRADGNGEVDVDVMESLGGEYEGVFPMGLFGSLAPAPNEYKYTRFFKRDVENPNLVTISVHDGHLSAETLCSSEASKPLSSVVHERHYMAPGVQRIPVRYGKVRGALFLPPGDGPFPGVVDMFGTAGGLLEFRSAQLASRGFASLALAFFNYDDLPKGLEEFDIAYFEEAVEYLLKHEKVLGYGVGVIGTSKGGDLAVSMAAFIPSVIACVTINGFFAPCNQGMRVEGHLYPPFKWDQDRLMIADDGRINVKSCIPDHKSLVKYMLPLEKSQSAFLFLVGIDDQNVNSEFQAQGASKYLSSHNYKHDYLVESYPGVGHLLEPPYSPHCYASFQHTFMSAICWGGSCKYHTLGQERAWEKMQNFLWYHLVERVQINNEKSVTSVPLRSHL